MRRVHLFAGPGNGVLVDGCTALGYQPWASQRLSRQNRQILKILILTHLVKPRRLRPRSRGPAWLPANITISGASVRFLVDRGDVDQASNISWIAEALHELFAESRSQDTFVGPEEKLVSALRRKSGRRDSQTMMPHDNAEIRATEHVASVSRTA